MTGCCRHPRRMSRALIALCFLACWGAASASATDLEVRGWRADSASRISAPPPLTRPMVWSRSPRSDRQLQDVASSRALVIGLAANEDVVRLRPPLSVTPLPRLHAAVVRGPRGALAALARSSVRWIRYVEAPAEMQSLDAPNDPFVTLTDPASGVPYEWNVGHVGADQALSIASGDPSILVGDVDSGVAVVPDLTGQVAQSLYFPSDAADSSDTEGHGTFVASLIGARPNDGFGLTGFCGLCRLIPFKVNTLTSQLVASAITQLADQHVRVINLSIGSPTPSLIIRDAINYAINAGVLIVASSGNESTDSVSYPAAFLQEPNGKLGYGLAVGATTASDQRAQFSNWGSALSISAPGSYGDGCSLGILGALPAVAPEFESGTACARVFGDSAGNLYAYASGTSFSAPEVAGAAALVWSVRPTLKNYQVVDILEQTATRATGVGWTPTEGWGVLNVFAAVSRAKATGSTAPPTSTTTPAPQPGSVGSTGSTGATREAVRLSALKLQGTLRPGTVIVASANASVPSGSSVSLATVHCTVSVADTVLHAVGRVAGSKASCAWKLPKRGSGSGAVSLVVRDAVGESAMRSTRFRVSAPK